MTEMTRVAIVGYGNIGRGAHAAILKNHELYQDIGVVGIITRRPGAVIEELTERTGKHKRIYQDFVLPSDDPSSWKKLEPDVAILCGGSKADLPVQGPVFASYFNTVDSFDTHDHIHPWTDDRGHYRLGHFKEMDNSARANNNTAVVCSGWDPGISSVMRILFDAILPGCNPRAFYGLNDSGGLSQGHSDAIRQIPGVKDASQYTHARHDAIGRVKAGENPVLSKGDMHWRECYVVLENDTQEERERVKTAIVTEPTYFAPYQTEVHFVGEGELLDDMPHDGIVLASGTTGEGNPASLEYRNVWASNPGGTAGILVASTRAAHKMSLEGKVGAFTLWEALPYITPRSQKYRLQEQM